MQASRGDNVYTRPDAADATRESESEATELDVNSETSEETAVSCELHRAATTVCVCHSASTAEWLGAWDTLAMMKREVVSSIPDRGTIQ